MKIIKGDKRTKNFDSRIIKTKIPKLVLSLLIALTVVSPINARADADDDAIRAAILKVNQEKIADRANSFRSQGFSYGSGDNLDDGYRKNIEMDCSIMSRKAVWQIAREDGGLTMSYRNFVTQVGWNSVGQNSWFSKNLPFSTSKLDTTYGINDSRRFKGGSYYPSSQINTKRISDVGGSNRLEIADEAWPLFKKGDILLYDGHVSIVYEAGRHSTTNEQAATLGNGYAKLIHALRKDYPRGNPAITQTATAKGGSFLGFVRLNEQAGDLEIKKTTETGVALSGVTFQLSKNSNMSSPIGSKTTGSNGIVSWTGLEVGTYYYRETAAPENYSFDSGIKTIEVKSGTKSTVTVINNKVTREVAVIKKDATSGELLPGAVFGLYNSSNAEVARATTNSEGRVVFTNVPKGVYTVKEISAPVGYHKSDAVFTTTKLNTNNQSGSEKFEFTNTRQNGEINIQKFEGGNSSGDSGLSNTVNNGQGFVGTQFQIKLINPHFSGESYQGVATVAKKGNSNYLATATNIPLGRYEIREIKATEGYEISNEVRYVNLVPNGASIKYDSVKKLWVADNVGARDGFSNEVIKQNTVFRKKSKTNNLFLSGVEFNIFRDDNLVNPFMMAITAPNGFFLNKEDNSLINSMDYGKYQFVETKTKEGYYISESDWKTDVAIGITTGTVELEFDNAPQSSVIRINKVDVETGLTPRLGTSLSGAKYEVVYRGATYQDIVDNDPEWKKLKVGDVVETLTTDSKGFAQTKSRLPIGVYDIIEVSASSGYRKEVASTRIETLYDGGSVGQRPQGKDKTILFRVLADNRIPVAAQIDDLNQWLNGHISSNGGGRPAIPKIVPHKLNSVTDGVVYVSEAPELGRFEIVKKYEQAGSTIIEVPEVGAVFNVIDSSGKVVDTITTNKNGYASSKYLSLGQYKIVQTKGPEGWYLAEDISTGIDLHLETKSFEVTNKMVTSRIKVIKKDASTGNTIPLSGVSFQLYSTKTGGSPISFKASYPEITDVDTFETNKNGEVILPMLLGNGTYFLKEVKAPDGYYLEPNGERIEVVVNGSNIDISIEEFEVEVPNIPQYAKLHIEKKGEMFKKWETELISFQGKEYELYKPVMEEGYLTGAEFKLTAKDDIFSPDTITKYFSKNDTIATFVTNSDGKLTVKSGSYIWNPTTMKNELLTSDKVYDLITLPIGKYNLVETATPDGYQIDKTVREIVFNYQSQEIKFDSKSTPIWNEKLSATFKFTKSFEEAEWNKYHDEAPEQTLFGLFNKNDLVINGVTLPAGILLGVSGLDENLSGSFDALFAGEYYIQELATHEAYELNDGQFGLEFNYDSDGPVDTEVEIDNIENQIKTTKVKVTKVDSESREGLPFAEYELYIIRENGLEELIGRYMTDENGYLELDLEYGNYKLYEVKPPKGYVTDGSEVIEIPSDGGNDIEVEHENEKSKVEISKKDKTDESFVEGAHMVLIDKETGDIIESWITDKYQHQILGLEVGKTYIVREVKTPDGYVTAEAIEFVVENSRYTQSHTMYDDITRLEVHKKDIDTGEYVVGSVLQIFKKGQEDLGPVFEWTTDENLKYIEKLPVGEYFLRELSAPGGYLIAEDIEFEILDTGEIQTVEMFDDYIKVVINKIDGDTQRHLAGAHLVLTDENGVIIKSWISDGNPVEFNYLPAGNYILTETLAPNGYTVAEPINIVVDEHGELQEFTLANYRRTATLEIKKESGTYEGKKLDGAIFKIEEFDEMKEVTGRVEYYESGSLNINYEPNTKIVYSKFSDFRKQSVVTTNENGFASVSGLEEGQYYWKALDGSNVVHSVKVKRGMIFVDSLKHGFNYLITEIKAPDGYVVGDTPSEWFTPSVQENVYTVEYKKLNSIGDWDLPPSTGDNSNVALYAGLSAMSIVGLAWIVISWKREEDASN